MRSVPINTKVLFIGLDAAAPQCFRRLAQAGVKRFTVVNNKCIDASDLEKNDWLRSSASEGQPAAEAVAEWLCKEETDILVESKNEDPLSLIETSPEFVLSFDLVLTMGVERNIELGYGGLLFETRPYPPMIISRSDGFHAKMRSQYRIHKVTDEPGNVELQGIHLVPRPEPPLPEKCERVRKATAAAIHLSSPDIQSALLLIYASSSVFKATQGYPAAHRPAEVSLAGHEPEVEAIIRNTIAEKEWLAGASSIDPEVVKAVCDKGWSEHPLAATIMGALIAEEGITLLTRTGRPVNCVPLDLAALAALEIPVKM